MATIAVVEPTTGTDPGFVSAAGGGDQYTIDDYTVFHVRNGGGSSVNVTFASQYVAEVGKAAANVVVAVPAGANRDVRIKPSALFKDANGRCQVTYSAVTSVTVAATRAA